MSPLAARLLRALVDAEGLAEVEAELERVRAELGPKCMCGRYRSEHGEMWQCSVAPLRNWPSLLDWLP